MCEHSNPDPALFRARSQHALKVLANWKEANGNDWMPLWKMHRRMPWRASELQDVLEALLSQRLIGYRGIRGATRAEDFYKLECTAAEIRAHAEAGPASSLAPRRRRAAAQAHKEAVQGGGR